jgi:hypothetical protein
MIMAITVMAIRKVPTSNAHSTRRPPAEGDAEAAFPVEHSYAVTHFASVFASCSLDKSVNPARSDHCNRHVNEAAFNWRFYERIEKPIMAALRKQPLARGMVLT